ncbi:proteasome regulatory particle base subunit rpn10 [Lithohypha guttulata]|uniref:Proteasome regulatory particle base subunit rpn10 n=1 Tax=Lithohypha guttulata TaxID=1690604 RepID=A0AAN7T4S4_9EURO|nr:proteasome regulatory particle base subunit rpn10 [Lithohypha guttulata]
MPLEATMICVDNSEAARNGDYLPTRFQAQSEAVSLIFNAKTQSNPESAVGLLSMAGTSPQVLNTPTTNFGAVLAGLHDTKIKGTVRLGTAISVAMLALKHRANKSQRQRVIVLMCSEIEPTHDSNDSEKELIKLAKKCKKNNVSVDFVAFGDATGSETRSTLEKFIEAVGGASSNEGNYLAVIPPGPGLLSDTLVTTPIVNSGAPGRGDGMEGVEDTGAGAGGSNGFEFGIDPATDPELAMALRMSMEEEQNRLDRERRQQEQNGERMETITEEGGSTSNDSKQPRVEDDKSDGKS